MCLWALEPMVSLATMKGAAMRCHHSQSCSNVIFAKRAKQGFTHCFAHTKLKAGLRQQGQVQAPQCQPDMACTTTKNAPTLLQKLRAKNKKAKQAIAKGQAHLAQLAGACTGPHFSDVAKSTKEQRQQWTAHRKYLDTVAGKKGSSSRPGPRFTTLSQPSTHMSACTP